MSTLRLSVFDDEEKALIEKERLKIKGYTVNIETCSNIVVDTRDLGGTLEYLSDPDGDAFVLVAK
ncbi:hypothetical protein [Psychromonas aquimarina]|uniref:hypothetical protein n=1 Tax=Psychromonas aquimarina TaxID=444919 RepID=UPI0003FDE257|nr:hypothetical protein [Psychromonas aquimarina]